MYVCNFCNVKVYEKLGKLMLGQEDTKSNIQVGKQTDVGCYLVTTSFKMNMFEFEIVLLYTFLLNSLLFSHIHQFFTAPFFVYYGGNNSFLAIYNVFCIFCHFLKLIIIKFSISFLLFFVLLHTKGQK